MMIVPIQLLVLIVIANRYLVGVFLKTAKRKSFSGLIHGYEPTVSVVIPLFNEGRQIYDTIHSLLKQNYPPEKLEIVIIDDCSTDDSFEWAKKAEADCPTRVKVMQNPYNMGKRKGINRAVREANSEIIVSVDSDVNVDQDAVLRLVERFTDPQIAAVGGRVNVSNLHDNWLTRMQTIKYYFGFVFLKSIERAFQQVMCLSGCLTAYRRDVLLELEPILEQRNVLGVSIKYGEDRFLTRQIVKAGYRTTLTLDAQCWTVAPKTLQHYFSQQIRWRRSNLVDFMCGLTHAWQLHPMVALHYVSLAALLVAYPIIVFVNIMAGNFWILAQFHLVILTLLSFVYWADTRTLPREQRVHPLWFLPLGILMPMTYLLFTPLALFTLDSGSWETRGHQAGPEATSPQGTLSP